MIPENNWKWFGQVGHLIVGQWCQFHLCTLIGEYMVSTVGQYLPPEGVREVLANCRNIELEGQGENREADYLKKVGFENVGAGRKYETMVFNAKPCVVKGCDCGGHPVPTDHMEIDFDGYNSPGDATAGHYRLCRKWAEVKEFKP